MQRELSALHSECTKAKSQNQAKAAEIHALKTELQNREDASFHEFSSQKHSFELEMSQLEYRVQEAKSTAAREVALAEQYKEIQSSIVDIEMEARAQSSRTDEAQTIELHNMRL
eukprot:4384697-Amphidinium_carterae.1